MDAKKTNTKHASKLRQSEQASVKGHMKTDAGFEGHKTFIETLSRQEGERT